MHYFSSFSTYFHRLPVTSLRYADAYLFVFLFLWVLLYWDLLYARWRLSNDLMTVMAIDLMKANGRVRDPLTMTNHRVLSGCVKKQVFMLFWCARRGWQMSCAPIVQGWQRQCQQECQWAVHIMQHLLISWDTEERVPGKGTYHACSYRHTHAELMHTRAHWWFTPGVKDGLGIENNNEPKIYTGTDQLDISFPLWRTFIRPFIYIIDILNTYVCKCLHTNNTYIHWVK